MHADYHAATWIQSGTSTALLFGNDGGLSISYDKGKSWDVNTLNMDLVTSLVQFITITKTQQLVIGLQDNGSMYSKDQITGDFNVYAQTVEYIYFIVFSLA